MNNSSEDESKDRPPLQYYTESDHLAPGERYRRALRDRHVSEKDKRYFEKHFNDPSLEQDDEILDLMD